MKKNLKIAKEPIAKTSNKGITLIALVVTIVVLLILAGITITAVLSDGGIFNTAKRAQSVQDEAAIREKVNLMLADAQLQKLINNTDLKAYLTGKGYSVTEDTTAGTVTITEDGYNVTVDASTYQITEMTKAEGSGSEGGQEPDEPSNPTVAVTGITLNQDSATMTVGGSLTLTATVEPQTASNKAVTWTSSVPAVATVTNGVVNALTAGSTTITVTTADGSFTDTCEITVNEPINVSTLVGQPASNTNIYAQDKYGNKIVIPAGFKVLANGSQNVVYDYDKEGETSTGEPVVQDGIVIQHGTDENEFVWVPVGTIKNDTTGASTTNIQLGRYEDFTMNTETTPPTPFQVADEETYDTVTELIKTSSSSQYGYFENSTGTYDGTQYKSIGNFTTLGSWIENTIDNGGYYIARYEASYGANGVALSKPSTGTPLNSTSTNKTAAKSVGQLYNWVTQPEASDASKAMYQASENLGYYSELVNSYAWDTAIIFIQTYEDVDYASQESLYKDTTSPYQPANTGERGADAEIGANTTDKVCNIYDMASNEYEWTTETYLNYDYPCVYRGGYFRNSSTTSGRIYGSRVGSTYALAFRSLLNCNAES